MIDQMIARKDQEIAVLKAAIEFDLDQEDDGPSGQAVETLRLLIEQRRRLKAAVEILENPASQNRSHENAETALNVLSKPVFAWVSAVLFIVPAVMLAFMVGQTSSPGSVNDTAQTTSPSTKVETLVVPRDVVREAVREMAADTTPSELQEKKSSLITFQMGEIFDDLKLSAHGKKKLREVIVSIAANVTSESSAKELSIRVFHSPTFREKLTDPASRASQAYKNKLKSTNTRAQNIFNYLFGEEIGEYPNKTYLQSITRAEGRSFEDPVMISSGSKRDPICGKIDCAASRRVEFSF